MQKFFETLGALLVLVILLITLGASIMFLETQDAPRGSISEWSETLRNQ